MPHAVTHVLIAIIIADIIRDYLVKDNKKFPLHYILIAGIAGLLPDIDVIAYWFLNLSFGTPFEAIHRVYTHTLIIPIIILAAGLIIWKSKRLNINLGSRMSLGPVVLVIAFGYFIHIILDFLIIGAVYPLYPLSSLSAGLNLVSYSGIGGGFMAGLDAILLVLWLVHEEIRHKISDYI